MVFYALHGVLYIGRLIDAERLFFIDGSTVDAPLKLKEVSGSKTGRPAAGKRVGRIQKLGISGTIRTT